MLRFPGAAPLVPGCAGQVRNLPALPLRPLLLGLLLVVLSGTSAAAASEWQSPLRPLTVTRHFERPPTPYAAGHRGVDLAGTPAQAVLAAGSGLVSYAGQLAGRGVVVVVHGVLRTTYEPVQPTVRRGAQVRGGQEIGTLQAGHPGCPVPACLHWGLLRGDTYLDPLALLGAQRIRLLPLGETRRLPATPAVAVREQSRAAATMPAPGTFAAANPGITTWSAAALAGAGVLVVRRRR
jgi:murein DD-endopeptidase MepM/ murein hydrolase activator NlpD